MLQVYRQSYGQTGEPDQVAILEIPWYLHRTGRQFNPAFFYPLLSHFRVILMDWLAAIAFIAGIILLIIGISLVFHLSAVMAFLQEILGVLCLILGVIALIFGTKLARSV
jgi:hypothetical protein